MVTAASRLNRPIAGEFGQAPSEPAATMRVSRYARRRNLQLIIALCYSLDAGILGIYSYAGLIPPMIPLAYLLTGSLCIAVFLLSSETGFNDRFREHYFAAPQSAVGIGIELGFLCVAPEVGIVFVCSLMTIFGLGALRSKPTHTVQLWTIATFGLAALFLVPDTPIGMPTGSHLERFATLLVFVMSMGRCMSLGIFSGGLSQSLYRSGVKLKEANSRIQQLAEIDELTGALNRRCIMQNLGREVERARASSSPFSIALIDLDLFKKINDVYGHPVGDEVLRTFSITVFANIRPIDRFGRYGGEEFLLLLPGTRSSDAARIIDRLRMIIADLDWNTLSPDLRATMSAGIATLNGNETADAFLARADAALYCAKANGRNCIATS
jgi:diguanylate cyclase (GGDEF)-like protein